jgi:predicted enzyme related to lactoylglutathione lyase
MGDRTSYLPGTPSYVDLGSPDMAASATFYGGLFGWTTRDLGPDAGGYQQFELDGKVVAGLGPQQSPDMPPFWTVYVTVANVEESLAAVTAAGGTVVVDAMDVLEAGRMAVVQDPVGSFISLWQPMGSIGAERVNDPGCFGWNELATPDLATSTAFYRAVFGWGLDADASNEGSSLFTVDGEMVCGAHTAGEGEFPAWSVWFSVDDCDASTATATELGATVYLPPNDMSFGRGAVVADPQGAVFGLASVDPAQRKD